jgi:hypothetical protein
MQHINPETCESNSTKKTTFGKFGGRPKGAYSKVSPKIRARILRDFQANVPISLIARQSKVSRCWVYHVLKQEGITGNKTDENNCENNYFSEEGIGGNNTDENNCENNYFSEEGIGVNKKKQPPSGNQ